MEVAIKKEKGETFLAGETVIFHVITNFHKTRNPYICKLLKYKGYGNTAQECIYDAHRKYYAAHPEELIIG